MSDTSPDRDFDAKALLRTLPGRPGVYRMLDAQGEVIYVGKARDLKKRVSSYFRRFQGDPKTHAMVGQVRDVEITVTHTESEALLLENNLIKALKPRYNVVLRDDKSYPYIYVSTDQDFPRVSFHRGARRGGGRYFGPHPSASAVRETMGLLQKLFPIRQCEDSYYRNRSRPCLQYQIGRCTAPCVDYVSRDAYGEDVRHTLMFLEGKSAEVTEELVRRMEEAATALEFERAARYRDQIGSLRRVQEKQYISGAGGISTCSPPPPSAASAASRCFSSGAAVTWATRPGFRATARGPEKMSCSRRLSLSTTWARATPRARSRRAFWSATCLRRPSSWPTCSASGPGAGWPCGGHDAAIGRAG